MSKKVRILLLLVFMAFLIFYGIMVFFHIKNPIMFDEVHHAKAAEMIATTGKPVIYHWCMGSQPWIVMIAHSAMYINLLALAYILFGISDLTGYLFGVTNALLTLTLMVFTIRLLFNDTKKSFIVCIIASCFYLINPLLIRGSLILDIDTTVLMSCILLFILVFVKPSLYSHKNNAIYLSLAFVLCLWAKETCLLFLFPAVFLYLLLSKQRNKITAWLKWAAILVGGFIIFLATWWFYCRMVDLPFTYIYEYTILGRTGEFLFASLYSRLATIRNHLFWLSPFFVLLTVLAVFGRINNFVKIRKVEPLDFIAILGVIMVGLYTLIMPTTVIPKYIVPLVPIFSIVISSYLYDLVSNFNKKFLFLSIGIAMLSFLYYLILFPDPLFILMNKQIPTGNFWKDVLTNKASLLLIYSIPLFLVCVIFKKNINSRFTTTLAASLLILFVPSSVSLSLTQALSSYATFYYYGERGLKETISYLKNNVDRNEVIFGRKEFEYYLPNRVYFDITGNTKSLEDLLEGGKISYIVFSDYFENEKALASKLESTYKKIYKCGNFSVYKI